MNATVNSSGGPRRKRRLGSIWATFSAVTEAGLRTACRGHSMPLSRVTGWGVYATLSF